MTNSSTGSKSSKVNADENIQRAVEIVNEKEYAAKYDPNYSLNKNLPTIIFGEMIHIDSFHELPKGWISAPRSDSEFLLSFNTANGDMQSVVFAEASANLLKWAQELEGSVQVYLEINVPYGEDHSEIMELVEEELGLFDPEIQYWGEDGESDEELGDDLQYSLRVTPQVVDAWESKLKAFEKLNGFETGISWLLER